jgi:predicted negative regulator of RcsB-dependent stress response
MENSKNYWKTGVIVTLIFLIGYLAGIGTLFSLRYVRERNIPAMRNPAETLTMLSEKLTLNQAQKSAVREIVLQTGRDLFTIREEARPQVRKRLESARDEIAALLNEEQREQFDRLVEERLEPLMDMRKRMPRGRNRMR